jgi:hypothetical protein
LNSDLVGGLVGGGKPIHIIGTKVSQPKTSGNHTERKMKKKQKKPQIPTEILLNKEKKDFEDIVIFSH